MSAILSPATGWITQKALDLKSMAYVSSWHKLRELYNVSRKSDVQIFVCYHIPTFDIRNLKLRNYQPDSYGYQWKTEMGRTAFKQAW